MDGIREDVPVLHQPVKLAYIWNNSFDISPEIATKLMHTDFSSIGLSLYTYLALMLRHYDIKTFEWV